MGIAHSRFCDEILDPAQLILRFPPQNGEKATVMQTEKHEKTMQCVQLQMSYAMTHAMLCSITIEIELPFDRSRRK